MNGILEKKSGTINLPIGRKNNSIIERCVDFEKGKSSITHYRVLKEYNYENNCENDYENYSLLECTIDTGRTHQIRVHTSSIGHPIIGDTLYGTKSEIFDTQALHSYKITCIHPISKENLTFTAPRPF